jgi:uncharacterized protein YfiM (DUF2279 family)
MLRPTAIPHGFLLAVLVLLQLSVQAQQDTLVPDRRCLIGTTAGLGAGMAGSLVLLERAWYADFERSSFHTFDDSGEWLQVDKAGHFFSAYTLGRWGHALLDRCGTRGSTATWLGGSLGLVFLTGVEVLDGTSAGWGFSWSDMAANVAGAGFFVGQQLLWEEQRIHVKFSAQPTRFAEMRPSLLGEGLAERILKDYNGQTFWLSANINRLTGLQVPEWLAIAGGYGATGMITAHPPEPMMLYYGHERLRQFYLSPDIDLMRFRTRSKLFNTVLFVLNGVKVPLPTLEIRSDGRVLGHLLHF